jgi:hypothetical protein
VDPAFWGLVKDFFNDALAFDGLHPCVTRPILLSLLVNNSLRYAWKEYKDRPRVVNLLIGVTDLPALNFWVLARWFGKRVGVDVPIPCDSVVEKKEPAA